jgi:hypothetical protein
MREGATKGSGLFDLSQQRPSRNAGPSGPVDLSWPAAASPVRDPAWVPIPWAGLPYATTDHCLIPKVRHSDSSTPRLISILRGRFSHPEDSPTDIEPAALTVNILKPRLPYE